ncbi:MAG: phospholipid/glycerol acyltransferase [Halomonadaceae bacterium T82-2]|nr:MAG: phospholipid/glycerol acyltransferase [Halomonadaceae bacterium T82-2]
MALASNPAPRMIRHLDPLWRRLITPLAFVGFAVAALTIGALFAPMTRLISPDRATAQRRTRHLVRLTCRAYLASLRHARLIDYRVSGIDRLAGGGRLLLANHPTLLDALFLLAYTPNANCIVKGPLARHPVTSGVIRAAGFITNRRPCATFKAACRALRGGQSLIVFPEGTRSTPGQPVRLRRGGAAIAVTSRTAVTPVRIRCRPSTLTKGEPWYRVPPRRPDFRIEVGRPLPSTVPSPTTQEAVGDLTQRLETYFNRPHKG